MAAVCLGRAGGVHVGTAWQRVQSKERTQGEGELHQWGMWVMRVDGAGGSSCSRS